MQKLQSFSDTVGLHHMYQSLFSQNNSIEPTHNLSTVDTGINGRWMVQRKRHRLQKSREMEAVN